MNARQDDDKDTANDTARTPPEERRHKVRLGGREIALPRSRWLRMGLGVAFIIGGLLGFLPIVGFWMLPLGLLILSYDLPFARRWRRRFVVWWHRWRERRTREGDD
jgi:hypothetical protein